MHFNVVTSDNAILPPIVDSARSPQLLPSLSELDLPSLSSAMQQRRHSYPVEALNPMNVVQTVLVDTAVANYPPTVNKDVSPSLARRASYDATKRERKPDFDDDELLKKRRMSIEKEAADYSVAPYWKNSKSRNSRKSKQKFQCLGKDQCALCKYGSPYYLQSSMNPGWRETILAVFEFYPYRITESEWKSKATGDQHQPQAEEQEWLYFPDTYTFLEYHWAVLCPPQHRNRPLNGSNWKKTLQDTLSHNRTFFTSGKDVFGKSGFWRLTQPLSQSIAVSTHTATSASKSPVPVAPHSDARTGYSIDSLLGDKEMQRVSPYPYSFVPANEYHMMPVYYPSAQFSVTYPRGM